MIRLFLPGIPGAKGRPRFNTKTGRAFTPSKTMRYETYLKSVMADEMGGQPPLDCPLRMTIEFAMPEPKSMPKRDKGEQLPHVKRPDLDNLVKAVMDAANGVMFVDDARVWYLITSKRYGDTPGTTILLEPYG